MDTMRTSTILLLSVLFFQCCFGKYVDLSHFYNDNKTVVGPWFLPFKLQIDHRGWAVKNNVTYWSEYNSFYTPEHLGTHIDAPAHLSDDPGNLHLHEIPIEKFIGDAVVIDISHKAHVETNPDVPLLVEDIMKWEARNGQIRDGSIVFLYSGWDQYWGDTQKFLGNSKADPFDVHFPGFSEEAAQWLIDNRNVNGVGSDCLSFDVGENKAYEAHRVILGSSRYGLENVNNLGKIPEHGARVYIMPMNIYDASGAPTRILAHYWDNNEHFSNSGWQVVGIFHFYMLIPRFIMKCI